MLTIHRDPKITQKNKGGGLFFSLLRKVDDGFVMRKSLSYMNYMTTINGAVEAFRICGAIWVLEI